MYSTLRLYKMVTTRVLNYLLYLYAIVLIGHGA